MTVMKSDSDPAVVNPSPDKGPEKEAEAVQQVKAEASEAKDRAGEDGDAKKTDNAFSDENVANDIVVEKAPEKPLDLGKMGREVHITAGDKLDFIDSVVNNTRYVRKYSLFGGKIRLSVRSLTADEVNALAAWTARVGTRDSAGLVSGRYRKYLVAAQVARYNDIDMPPLEEPLFETLGSDGKSVTPPGWLNRCDFWDGVAVGVFEAIMRCISDFDLVYATLCSKSEDANFWSPDTP